MRKKHKIILLLVSILLFALPFNQLYGCGCGGGGGSDASKDVNADGDSIQEQIPSRLNDVNTPESQEPCQGSTENRMSASASKSESETGYAYQYSYTIDACGSVVGYNVVLEGTNPRIVEQGIAPKGKQTAGSNSYTSSDEYTQICVRSGDQSTQDYCTDI